MVIAQASGRVYLSSGMKWIRLRQRRGGGRGRMSSHGRLTGHFMSHNVSYHGSLVDPVWPRGPGVQPCKVPNSQAVPGKRKLQAAVDQPTTGCSEEALGMESHFPPPRYPFVSADQAYICPGERVSVRRRGAVRVGSGRCYLFPGKLTVWRTHVNGQPPRLPWPTRPVEGGTEPSRLCQLARARVRAGRDRGTGKSLPAVAASLTVCTRGIRVDATS